MASPNWSRLTKSRLVRANLLLTRPSLDLRFLTPTNFALADVPGKAEAMTMLCLAFRGPGLGIPGEALDGAG